MPPQQCKHKFGRIVKVVAKGRVVGYRVHCGKRYVGFKKVKKDASKLLKDASVADCSAPGPEQAPMSNYTNTRPRLTKKGWVWEGYYARSCVIAGASTELVAAQAVAQASGKQLQALRKSRAERLPADTTLTRVAVLARAFRGWEPADLQSAAAARARLPILPYAAPGIYVASLLGKKDNWKLAVETSWSMASLEQRVLLPGAAAPEISLQRAAAKAMHLILVRALQVWASTSSQEERVFWTRHVNRNVAYHSALLPWAQKAMLLQKRAGSLRGSLNIVSPEKANYCVTAFKVSVHTSVMVDLHKTGLVLNSLQTPHTTEEWLQCTRNAGQRGTEAGVVKGDSYGWSWLVRTYLFASMRAAGISRLRVTNDWNTEQVVEALLPDQSRWLPHWMRSKGWTLKQLSAHLKDVPVEMLSCMACILGDTALDKFDMSTLEGNLQRIMKVRAEVRKKYGWEGNPSLVVSEALSRVP
jgi:hypothetical protein